ncbi:MAG: aldo/keto reductase [Hyphomicrobiaceae bacterium]
MEFTTLGNTSLNCSVAGLGCGGNSRLGLGRGSSPTECVELLRTAIDAGVNFIDTAESYGTEAIVGEAVKHYERDKLVISSKAQFDAIGRTADVMLKIDAALTRLDMEYIDIFHLHGVQPAQYEFAREELAPALLRAREQGKIRHIGITEVPPKDPLQETICRAVAEPPWEVVMLAYSMVNQAARETVFPLCEARGVGTLLMFVVRNFFSRLERRRSVLSELVQRGELPLEFAGSGDPLEALVCNGGANNLADAAYRFARHQKGAHVILFGTGSKDHLKANIESILRPPLDPELIEQLKTLFGGLTGVGLDLPDSNAS